MRTFIAAVLAAVLLALGAPRVGAVAPAAGEFDACRQWCGRVFGRSAKPPAVPFLELVRQDTAYSQGRDVWAAYQLDRADLGQGLVVALRREQSPYGSARFPLRGLEAQAEYRVANLDTGGKSVHSGKELMQEGIEVRLESRPDSTLLRYERTKQSDRPRPQ